MELVERLSFGIVLACFHTRVISKYWALTESRIPLKNVLGYVRDHTQIQRGGGAGGSTPYPFHTHGTSQSYRVPKQYWSRSPGKLQSYHQASHHQPHTFIDIDNEIISPLFC